MALPRSPLWLMGLMGVPPVRKERVLLAVERGGDSLTQLSRFRHEVIKPPQDATEGAVRRILSRHGADYCNWYSINYGLVVFVFAQWSSGASSARQALLRVEIFADESLPGLDGAAALGHRRAARDQHARECAEVPPVA